MAAKFWPTTARNHAAATARQARSLPAKGSKAETEELPANEEATQALKASRSVTGFYEDVNAIQAWPLRSLVTP